MGNIIDLHIHTTASDGADTVPEVLEKIKASDVRTFSITDHDTIAGAVEMDALVPPDLQYIHGIEFSCKTAYKGCHILGYHINYSDPVFQDALELGRRLRQEKLRQRVAFWESEFGIILTDEESEWLKSQNSPGKPNFARIILNRGLAPDINTAIRNYVNPCKVINDRIDADIAINAIIHASGIPVWAHPLGGEGERRLSSEEFDQQFGELLSCGIQGLECYYSRYTQKEIEFLKEKANTHQLVVSGGSDYHGNNRPGLHLGRLNAEDLIIDFSSFLKL